MKLVSVIIFLALIFLFYSSCTRDSIMEIESECVEEVSYNNQIVSIINNSCAYVGCHSGAAPGNFTSYDGIASYFSGDALDRRVLVNRDMPPDYAVGGPTSLTEEQLELFTCWVQAGYPEN